MTPKATLSTPALVIALDDFSTKAIRLVQSIYLRGDSKRKLSSDFMAVGRDEQGHYALVEASSTIEPISLLAEKDVQKEQARPALRKAVYWETIQNAYSLRTSIEQRLYAIQTHERLIEAGWAEETDVPMNIFLVADPTDPFAAGIFFPFCRLLQEIAGNLRRCQIHLLLTPAFFPSLSTGQDDPLEAEIYTFLLELSDFLNEKSDPRDALDQSLGIDSALLADMTVYLFDRHKEGSTVVNDKEKIQMMVENALLALLQKDISRRVAWGDQDNERAKNHNYYGGIGASAWIYDPASFQAACAGKLTAEFLDRELLNPGDFPPQKALRQVDLIREELGRLTTWLEEIVFQLHPSIGQTNIHPETGELSIVLTDLALPPFDYIRLNQTPWMRLISEYQGRFDREVMPVIQDHLKSNADTLLESWSKIVGSALDRLLTDPDMYPGGPENTIRSVTLLGETLEKEQKREKTLLADGQADQIKAQDLLDQDCREMQLLLDQAPKLPGLLRRLPRFARNVIIPLFFAWRFGKELFRLQGLRTEALGLMQTICAYRIQAAAFQMIDQIITILLAQIEAGKKDVGAFQEKLSSIRSQFSPEWPRFPLGSAENGWDPIFRVPILSRFLAEELFRKWLPDFREWTRRFVDEPSLFTNWQLTASESLTDWIFTQAQETYRPLWNYSLSEIVELQEAGLSRPDYLPVSELAAQSRIAALPLLRPDFDAAGGNCSSTISRHLLVGEPEWNLNQVLSQSKHLDGWEILFVGDPYLAVFLQVRHEVPLPALVDMTRSGKRKYQSLPANQKNQYRLLGQKSEDRDNLDPGLSAAGGSDVIHKDFFWNFKPRGAAKGIDQKISLTISRSRFEHYRRLPRLLGKWNCYAEEEMPEIRALAMEFQKLHAAQNWSTYNQAFNILKFTQACIPYRRDVDTTGFEDWARYPIETLVEETGDCEDVAILCAAIIARLGFQVVLLLYPRHLAFGVAGADELKGDYVQDPTSGKRYFYGEATSQGWHLGQIPAHYRGRAPDQILPVNILIKEDD